MSLDNILLGILREPASGYDIKQQFENVFNHFWSADLAQIYRALGKLEKAGLLESRAEPSTRGPERKVYRRTPAGRTALESWLTAGPVFGSEKFAYLAQIFFLAESDPGNRRAFFETLQAELSARLAALMAIEQGWRQECPADFPACLDDRDFYAWLTLDMGLRKTRALVEWAEQSLASITLREEGEGHERG